MKRYLYSILGNSQKLDGGAMFGNAPKGLWERWMKSDEHNRIDLSCRALLVKESDRWILFETGVGAFFEPRLKERYGINESHHVLLANLASIGLSHADIDVVVLSHLHFDHAGGLLSPYHAEQPHLLLFPNAKYVVSQKAWARAKEPHPRDKASFIPKIQELLEDSRRLELVHEGEMSRALGPDYKFHFSHGHTPGLMLTEFPGSEGPVVFAADLIPGRAWVHRSITMGYDRFPELLIDEKTALLTDLCQRDGRLFFTHDPDCALARVTVDERGRFGSTQNMALLSGELA